MIRGHPSRSPEELAHTLRTGVYTEVPDVEVVVGGVRNAYANVIWGSGKQTILVRCNKIVVGWPEPALIGLLAHELSHPALGKDGLSEGRTDADVIARGLGAYLAVERAMVGQYEDMHLKKDRYLGYRSIRPLLTPSEVKDLDRLMSELELAPKLKRRPAVMFHDIVVGSSDGHQVLAIAGRMISHPALREEADIKIVLREGRTLIYADEVLVADLDESDIEP